MRLLCTVAAAGWLTVQATVVPAVTLRASSVVERTFDQTAPHTYSVTLAARDFLFVAVEQRAIDVSLRLTDSTGAVVSDSDSQNGMFGFERVAFIAPV